MIKFLNAYSDYENLIFLYRDSAGGLKKFETAPEYIAYIKLEDYNNHPRAKRIVGNEKKRKNIVHVVEEFETGWVKLYYCNSYRREESCSRKGAFFEAGIQTYEGDVNPIRRRFADEGLSIGAPKRVYLDIETDSRKSFVDAENGLARVLSWALVDVTGSVKSAVLSADDDDVEKEMLENFWAALDPYDQVVAWNGDKFDFPVLKKRSKHLGIKIETRRWLYLDQMLLFKRQNLMSAESGEEKQSYALDSIAHALLGEGKDKLTEGEIDYIYTKYNIPRSKPIGAISWWMWYEGGSWRQRLLDYNIQDTALLHRIELKTGHIESNQALCDVCNVFPETRSLQPTVLVDGYMLRLGQERDEHFVTNHHRGDTGQEQFAGAYVMDPTCRGIAKGVHVGDFASLYPSIMVTFNISPETKLSSPVGGHCKVPATGIVFSTEKEGMLPVALKDLLALRKVWKVKKDQAAPGTEESKDAERRSNAYKTAANSFYGVMGSVYSRFYDRDLAESTTLSGAWLIKETIKVAKEWHGWEAVYADTDSLFIPGATEDQFRAFVKRCNADLYPKLLSAAGCKTNLVKLDYEKEFSRLVFTAAKRYIGVFEHYKGSRSNENSKPEIKGLEYKRGDTIRPARELQAEVIGMITRGVEDVEQYIELIESHQDRILNGEIPPADITLTKSVKEFSEYKTRRKKNGEDMALPAHVQVAMLLLSRGEEVGGGTRVGYVVVNGSDPPISVVPASDFNGEFDRYYYWERLVYPPTLRLLEAAFPHENWTRWDSVRPSRKQILAARQLGLFAVA